jgi:N-acetylmuramoyl-L-alanine amidase
LAALAAWAALWAVTGLAAGRPAPSLPGKTTVSGREYQELKGFASAKAMTFDWDGRSRSVRVASKSVRLDFSINQRDMKVNGVVVWLSDPVVLVKGKVYLSTTDARHTLEPLLRPPRNAPEQRVKVVALDPGHGGHQPGHQAGAELEKTHALLLARKVRSLLRAAGLTVVMTRDTDEFVDLEQRPAIARRQKADVFVSLHYNGAEGGGNSANGIEVYCLTPAGATSTNARGDSSISTKAWPGNLNNSRNMLLAFQVHKAMVGALETNDRGVRRARFAVLRSATMPAILVEGGFLSDPTEAQRIYSTAGRDQLARAIADGVLAYKRLVER